MQQYLPSVTAATANISTITARANRRAAISQDVDASVRVCQSQLSWINSLLGELQLQLMRPLYVLGGTGTALLTFWVGVGVFIQSFSLPLKVK